MKPFVENAGTDKDAELAEFVALLRAEHVAWAEPHDAPYLRGVPQLSSEMAQLAARRHLTPGEEAAISAEVERICQLIRTARMEWETYRAAAVPCP